MHLVRRAVTGALALTTAYALAACAPQDNGNNTLAGERSTPPPGPQTTGAAEPGGPVSLEAKDNEFVPKDITAKAGDITISFKNTGAAPHTFTNADLKVDQNDDAGKTVEITLKDVKPGTYKYVCKYHESVGMTGTLTVS